MATQPLSIWNRANYYSQAPQTRCKSSLARNTVFSPHTWIFIIKPILFRTSGNQRPTSHRCHHSANKSSGTVTSIFIFIYLLSICYLIPCWNCIIYAIWNLAFLHNTEGRGPAKPLFPMVVPQPSEAWGPAELLCGLAIIWSVSRVVSRGTLY